MIDDKFVQDVSEYCDRHDIASFKININDDDESLKFKLTCIRLHDIVGKLEEHIGWLNREENNYVFHVA
jgi:hypothetical protein